MREARTITTNVDMTEGSPVGEQAPSVSIEKWLETIPSARQRAPTWHSIAPGEQSRSSLSEPACASLNNRHETSPKNPRYRVSRLCKPRKSHVVTEAVTIYAVQPNTFALRAQPPREGWGRCDTIEEEETGRAEFIRRSSGDRVNLPSPLACVSSKIQGKSHWSSVTCSEGIYH